ncbi:MAG: chemotaxis protein CheD [Pseudomonadota bacterium]|nr:chemotaxis protein CheD [Pseudomonadota bacterium]
MPAKMAPRRSFDGAPTHVLHPGDVVCVGRGSRLETLLGSCVSVILSDCNRTVAAMCHIVHPDRPIAGPGDLTRGAPGAIDRMYELLSARGMTPKLCEAWIYGAGDMFPSMFKHTHVGFRNAQAVLQRLDADGVTVTLQDLGGRSYRLLKWTVGVGLPAVTANAIEVMQ